MTKTRYINEMTGEPYPDSKGESPVEDDPVVDINEKINDIRLSLLAQNESMHGYMKSIKSLLVAIWAEIILLILLVFKI